MVVGDVDVSAGLEQQGQAGVLAADGSADVARQLIGDVDVSAGLDQPERQNDSSMLTSAPAPISTDRHASLPCRAAMPHGVHPTWQC